MEIGVFGGSFDPPHLGHLAVAQDAQEALGLDLILFVPARVSPFKTEESGTDPDIRLRMVETALAGHPGFRVWDGELRRDPPSFTVDTLAALNAEYGQASLTLLMGEDQWASFPDWRAPERILDLARVAVLDREGHEDSGGDPEEGEWPSVRVAVRRMDISSTEIRERVREGRSIRFLVPESVRKQILSHNLYGASVADGGGEVPRFSRR